MATASPWAKMLLSSRTIEYSPRSLARIHTHTQIHTHRPARVGPRNSVTCSGSGRSCPCPLQHANATATVRLQRTTCNATDNMQRNGQHASCNATANVRLQRKTQRARAACGLHPRPSHTLCGRRSAVAKAWVVLCVCSLAPSYVRSLRSSMSLFVCVLVCLFGFCLFVCLFVCVWARPGSAGWTGCSAGRSPFGTAVSRASRTC